MRKDPHSETARPAAKERNRQDNALQEENNSLNRRDEYEHKLEEYVDALHSTSFSLKEYEAHHNEISKVERGYMIHTDIARVVARRHLKPGSVPPDDVEKL